MKNTKHFRLSTGMQENLSNSIFNVRMDVAYTGSPHPEIYSLAIIQTRGYNSFAYNIYIQADRPEIRLKKGYLNIISADANSIEFTYTSQ